MPARYRYHIYLISVATVDFALQVVFVPAPYIVRPMEEEVMNIQYYPGGGGGLLGNAFGSSKKLLQKLNTSLKMSKSKSTVENAELNATFIKVSLRQQ